MRTYDRNQELFNHYWYWFKKHYLRHLVKQDKDDANYAYKTCSQSKKNVYAYWNEWLDTRDGGDTCFTVLYSNPQTFGIGALYEVDAGDGHHIGVFIVVTPHRIYEWYVSYNSTSAVYIGRVPKHRVAAHIERSEHTEQYLDNEQALLALKGRGYYYG